MNMSIDSDKERTIRAIQDEIGRHKNTVITGEVGVGKITKTIEALLKNKGVCYVGNPFDYVGQMRPQGYEQYLRDVVSVKEDISVISMEHEILTMDPSGLAAEGAIIVVDEVFGRTAKQCQKIMELLITGNLKVVVITGCLKNLGNMIKFFDVGILLTKDGSVLIDKAFLSKLGDVLHPETVDW